MNTEYRPPPPSTYPVPAVPAEFEAIGPPLARGASAVVWRARNRVTGREVALKVWVSPLDTDEERSHFEAESRRHLELPENPHIVRWLWDQCAPALPPEAPPGDAAATSAAIEEKSRNDPFSIEDIEAEFARLLGRPLDRRSEKP